MTVTAVRKDPQSRTMTLEAEFEASPERVWQLWDVDEVQPTQRLVFRDGFAHEDGTPNTELPMTTARVAIEEIGGGKTRMSIESEFPTVEAMEQLAAMGMEEGLTQAVGQIDAILAEDPVEPGGGRR